MSGGGLLLALGGFWAADAVKRFAGIIRGSLHSRHSETKTTNRGWAVATGVGEGTDDTGGTTSRHRGLP